MGPQDNPADYVALVDLSSQRVWLLSQAKIGALSQQTSSGGHHLYLYVDPTVRPRKTGKPVNSYEFEKYLLQNCVHKIFNV